MKLRTNFPNELVFVTMIGMKFQVQPSTSRDRDLNAFDFAHFEIVKALYC